MHPSSDSVRSGTVLLICMSLVAAMVAVSFAYVVAMRTAAETGPSTIAQSLARQSARAGAAHACEMLMRDYLERPLVPTNDVSAHRVFFDPIDNQSPTQPRETAASGAAAAYLWNDNDVNPQSKNLNPYRQFNAHEGRVYDDSSDLSWLPNVVSSSTPRYVESMYYSLLPSVESSSQKTDFTKVPSVAPNVNTPVYYDSRWRPVASRDVARYRLRYGVWCEDLSGHIFVGLPAAFTRGDPLAVDGDLVASGKGNQGTEMDRAWAKRYAPQINSMFMGILGTDYRGLLWGGGGVQAYGIAWNGTDSTENESYQTSGFTTAGVMLGSSPWIWRNRGNRMNGVGSSYTIPWNPITSPVSFRRTGKLYSPQSINDISGPDSLALGGLLTPYGAPTRWDGNPDPETANLDELAYNEGPTDCPWRLNLLTAPANALRSVISGYRPSYLWEHSLTWKVTFKWDSVKAAWIIPSPIPANYPHVDRLSPPIRSNMGVPDPFRASFLTKDRTSGAINRRPFAQFAPSPSANDPRSEMDPAYPSPVSSAYSGSIGWFSDLEKANVWFGRGLGKAGPCIPRLESARRTPLQYAMSTYASSSKIEEVDRFASVYRVTGQDMVVYYGFDPWSKRSGADDDGDGKEDVDKDATWRQPNDLPVQMAYPNSYWLDAMSALYSSAAVAIALNQPGTPYPAAPSGGTVSMFAGKWGGGATLDMDADGDGFKESNSVITNVADLDRLFLLILGEDPDRPGSNVLTKSAVFASMPGGNGAYSPNLSNNTRANTAPFIPRVVGLPAYAPGTKDYSSAFEDQDSVAQNPYIHDDPSRFINLRRASLLGLRRGVYTNGESGLEASNDAVHQADVTALKDEAAEYVKGGGSYGSDMKTRAKHKQLMRCRLRDAERIVNDMRMSFFGANIRYLDKTRTAHTSQGRFRPYDLDGDGWAICSAYCPSDVVQVGVKDNKTGKIAYRFAEPTDWSKVVFDALPDNPHRIDGSRTLDDTTGSVWVCFQDVDTTAPDAPVLKNKSDSDFTDLLTYTSDDDVDMGPFPGSAFGGVPSSRAGYTRWFYPAVRVTSADDVDVGDGVAFYPPDTYFSLTGYFTFEKSRFYRMITRGEVWDEWRRLIVSSTLLETIFMLDPDGDVLVKTPSRPVPIDPTTHKVTDGRGLEDSNIIYQRWLRDYSPISRNRVVASP